MKCEPSYVSQRIKVYHKISVVSIGKMYFLEIFCSFIHIAFPKGQGYNCYSSLVASCGQIPCSHEKLPTGSHEGSAILWAKMSCEAAESIEDALLRMVRVNCNFSPFNTPTCNFLLANLHFLLYDCTGMTTEYALCKILSSWIIPSVRDLPLVKQN